MLELSTPVVKLWDGVLASAHDRHAGQRPHAGGDGVAAPADRGDRRQHRDHRHHRRAHGRYAGAQHLLKTITATRLMGADCIISGIRRRSPRRSCTSAWTCDVITKATLADAFALALERTGRDGRPRRQARASGARRWNASRSSRWATSSW